MTKTIRLAAPLQYESIVDGPGIRMVVWCQGCRVHCKGCHNPETQPEDGGQEYFLEDMKLAIEAHWSHHDGITFSGGDPFLQPEACAELAKFAKSVIGINVWAYCGLTYEEIIEDPKKIELLKWCDVLVDGPFMMDKRDTTLAFRGSSNQRLIDVQKSLKEGKVVLYKL